MGQKGEYPTAALAMKAESGAMCTSVLMRNGANNAFSPIRA